MPRPIVPLILAAAILWPNAVFGWGFNVHRVINGNAASQLPPGFDAFGQWTDDLERMSTQADERKCCVDGERIRHYINIDDYDDFFDGVLPQRLDDMISRFGLARVEGNGTVPWAIEESFDVLVQNFIAGDWAAAVSTAADIGHYVADLHNPMHLTTNFNGQETGQDGIHSRFETRMTNRHLNEFDPHPTMARYLPDCLGAAFDWIDAQYPGVALILETDRLATTAAGGNTSSETYYTFMWNELGGDTQVWVADASLAVASLWYTAWVEAGSPVLPGGVPIESTTWSRIKSRNRVSDARGASHDH